MTDTILTLTALQTLFQTLTMQMLGLDPAVKSSAYKVRIAWPTGGAPAWKITDDVVSIQCQEVDDEYNRQHDVVVSTAVDVATVKRGRTRVNGVTWVFRGPNSYDNAQLVKDAIFYDEHKLTLAKSNVYLIPDVAAPRRIPEPFQGQWWERVDLSMRFNELVIRNPTAATIATVPLTISDKDGVIVVTEIS